ncbi:MAG: histidinol-phosphate transaminase [Chloroflexota bacterium]
MFEPSTLLRPHIAKLQEYKPIQPFEVLSKRLERPAGQIIKLDANENPYGPVPAVAEALAEYPYYHIYPDPQQTELRTLLSEYIDVPAANILSSHGADELLDYLCRLFLEPGDAIINCPPTFGMYRIDAQLEGGQVIDVWRQSDHAVNIEAIIETINQHPQVKLLFLTSPNNPSGTWLPDNDLIRLLDLPLMVVLDEAYIEFADLPSRAKWALERPNLCVLRTFSKAAGIAGLRLGYGIFAEWLMEALWKFKQPYNVNVAASVAGIASLRHADQILAVVEKLKKERVRLFDKLESLSFLKPYPTQSNFILCDVVGQSGAELKAKLEQKGILVRYYDNPGLENCIRISVGRPEQTDRLMEALRLAG